MSFNSGDIIIHKAIVSAAAGSVDISRRIHSFKIFEHIMKPFVTLKMTILDSADLLNYNLGLDGTNTIDLSFGQPGMEPYAMTFMLMSIEKGSALENLRTQTYYLTGYSPHMKNHPKPQRSYRDMPGTAIAADLINTYLKPSKPLQIGDVSKGMLGNKHMPHNINALGIHNAIKMTLLRSASSKNLSSAYVFFENRKALIIDTLENLAQKAQSPNITFYQRPMGQDFLRDALFQNFIIINMKEESRIDATDTTQDQSQQARPYDLFGLGTKLAGALSGAASSNFQIPMNALRPKSFMNEVIPARAKLASQFDSQSITIQVPYNTALIVGEGFSVQTLAPAGDTEIIVLDKISGPLLCTEVCHSIDLTKKKLSGTSTAKGVKYPPS